MPFRTICARLVSPLFALCLTLASISALAQTGGQGAITGTVTDSTGALIPGASVVAVNVATGVSTTRITSSDGLYNISPLLPGTYTLTITAKGFNAFKQQNLVVDALSTLGFNAALKIGSENDTITVTDAPPQLDTTSASLGGVIEN